MIWLGFEPNPVFDYTSLIIESREAHDLLLRYELRNTHIHLSLRYSELSQILE
jgi:hypothetical protein